MPTQKFTHLSSSLKGEVREEISDLWVNDQNYLLAIGNLYKRYGVKKEKKKEFYKGLEDLRS